MPTIEKYGGLWWNEADDGWRLIYERHDPTVDRIAAVFSKGISFKAVTFEKSDNPQWVLPWWVERRPEAMFPNLDDAIMHAEQLVISST
jgi:hypothetical protein